MKTQSASALALAAAFVGGCAGGSSKPRPLTADAFISPRNGTGNVGITPSFAGESELAPGESVRPNVQVPANTVAGTIDNALRIPTLAAAAPAAPNRADVGARPVIPDVVQAQIRPVTAPRPGDAGPAAADVTRPATAPGTLPSIGASSGQYMTLGGVVAEVNGTPIYANKILGLLDESLRTLAKQLDADAFRRRALVDIRNTIMAEIRNELEYAAAQRNLDADDRRLADASTIYWRQGQLTQAGGSLELARRRAADKGQDFDEQTQEQQRTELIRIYYSKKVYPKIQVSANDLREYYDKNVDKEYSENEQVKFRLIKVDIKKTGSKEAALDKIADKYKRAKAGEDFVAMARRENDETMFAGEKPFDVAPKSFAIAKVRDALAKLNPGEVSGIIEDPTAFYLVKLEERKAGRVRPFEEQAVQDDIRFKLKSRQLAVLREQVQQGLMKGAIIRTDEQMAQIALDMAMQKYPQYAAAK